MKSYIPESYSLEEVLRIHRDTLPDMVIPFLERIAEEQLAMNRQVAALNRELELSEEQVSNARHLVESISHFVDNDQSRSGKAVREHITTLIENSYFEL